MRRIGIGLIILGLLAALVAVLLQDTGAGTTGRAQPLDLLFFAGVAAIAFGALLFMVRVLVARRRLQGSSRPNRL